MDSLSDQAYDRLEEMIVTLQLKPGSVISEGELVTRLGIGRTPVREALLRLVSEHMVDSIPRKGIAVSDIKIDDQLALLETRRALERIIACKASKRATSEQRAQLRTLASQMESAAEQQNMASFIHVDHAFDVVLAQACRNFYAAEACAPLRTHCRRFWFKFHHNEDMSVSAHLHARLMNAVADGDENAAGQASDELMNYLEKITRETIDK